MTVEINGESLQALCAIARFHQVPADPATLAHQMGLQPSDPVGVGELLRAAKQLGLKAKLSSTTVDRLPLTPLPALALMTQEDGGTRVVILAHCDQQRVLLQDPGAQSGRPTIEPVDVFASRWSGELILIASRASLAGELARFDFSWFIPAIVKYRKLLAEVMFISLMLQLFALVSPLFFQVVMDKVLVHKGVTTLDVLVAGLVAVVVFESALNGLRSYVFSHTTSRIDVELGARLFRHLVQLPLAYFQARRVGDSVARVRELENIRSFLTGNALTVVLDLLFSFVFVAVMLCYSVTLTLIVLASLPLYFAVSLVVVPILRKRLDVKFARGAENQAMLVETVTGIQTVKAGALEPSFARRWDNQLAAYVVDDAGDVVTELLGEGMDSVSASVNYTLGFNLENLTLTGSAAINGTGNTLANTLTGNDAANVLQGLAGNDTLVGGLGADRYVFGRGDGADTIRDTDSNASNVDSLAFAVTGGASRIDYSNLWFSRVGNDLQVSVMGTADKVSIANWYLGAQNQVERIEAGGESDSVMKVLSNSAVGQLVSAMAGMAPAASATSWNNLSAAQNQQLRSLAVWG